MTMTLSAMPLSPATTSWAWTWSCEILGRSYGSVEEMVGVDSPYQSAQEDVHVARLHIYAERMKEGRWDWSRMRALDVNQRVVEDAILVGRTPAGRLVLKNGHHRYVAARMTGTPIPPEAVHFEDWSIEPTIYPWRSMTLMLFDPRGFYPVLTPP